MVVGLVSGDFLPLRMIVVGKLGVAAGFGFDVCEQQRVGAVNRLAVDFGAADDESGGGVLLSAEVERGVEAGKGVYAGWKAERK